MAESGISHTHQLQPSCSLAVCKNGRELYYANLTMKELVKFSYIGCEIVLHFFREDAEESPFVNELVTRQLNETDWICNLIVRSTVNTTRGENNTSRYNYVNS